jgi:hypothetical protein
MDMLTKNGASLGFVIHLLHACGGVLFIPPLVVSHDKDSDRRVLINTILLIRRNSILQALAP